MATATYTASLRTREAKSSSNHSNSAAYQEFYTKGKNYIGIIHFAGLSLKNKVITGVSLTVTAERTGFGAGTTKTVYLYQSNYQSVSQSGVTGSFYPTFPLGTFEGSFYGNTTSYTLSGALLENVAAYIAKGNNTFCLYNPSPAASYQGYSENYMQWSGCTMTVAYTEGVSTPTVSSPSVDMGAQVTIYTNRQSASAVHTLTAAFGGSSSVIARNVTDFYVWMPPLSLAASIPSATAGLCLITCDTYVGDELVGTKSCAVTLTVPASIVPSISDVTFSEAAAGIAEQFGGYVRAQSKLAVKVSASGAQGSAITGCRTTVGGVVYNGAFFTTGVLNTAGNSALSVTVTDSRGRTAAISKMFSVLDYNEPSVSLFKAERCDDTGLNVKLDGSSVRVSVTASASPVGNKNTMTCTVYYKASGASAWLRAATVAPNAYAVAAKNLLLPQTFDPLSSYDFKVTVQDYFSTIEQTVSIGTKQVMMDFYKDGSGVAFGKTSEKSGYVEFGWPIQLTRPLDVTQGGTGAATAALARVALGVVSKMGDTMTGNLTIQNGDAPSLILAPDNESAVCRGVVEARDMGSVSLAAWEDASGNNRRMIEVRNAAYAPGIDEAVLLRTAVNDVYTTHRIFHAGMTSPVPIQNGGTGAADAATARANLGCDNASNLTTGTIPTSVLGFRIQRGTTTVTGVSWTTVPLSGFSVTPTIVVSFAGNAVSSGINVLKTGNESAAGFQVCMAGSSGSGSRSVNWIAIGV